jgi:hypothetical protein
MLRAIEMGWWVLDKYYNMTEEVPVYAAALILDPSRRTAYLKKNWPAEWYEPAFDAAHAIWEREFKDILPLDLPIALTLRPPPITPVRPHQDNGLDQLLRDNEVVTSEGSDIDDFRTFAEAPTLRIDCTPLEWWCRPAQRNIYPKLSRMAITILSIPAESSEPERTFSGTRRTCSWDRGKLTCANIERIECTGSWIREGHIRPLSHNGMGLPMEPEDNVGEIDDEDLDDIEWI